MLDKAYRVWGHPGSGFRVWGPIVYCGIGVISDELHEL